MSILERNRRAWNQESSDGSPWSRPALPGVIAAARRGDWQAILTPDKPVPGEWFGELRGDLADLGELEDAGFDLGELERSGRCVVKYRLPYAEPDSPPGKELARWQSGSRAAEFGHSPEAQVGGQPGAGFVMTGLCEDWWSDEATLLNRYMPTSIATRAVKPVEDPGRP